MSWVGLFGAGVAVTLDGEDDGWTAQRLCRRYSGCIGCIAVDLWVRRLAVVADVGRKGW